MNEVITREALQILFADETLFFVPEPARVEQGAESLGRKVEEIPQLPTPEPVAPPTPVVAAPEPDAPLAPRPQPPAPSPLPFRRETILLVDRPTPDDLALLENILKAVSLTLADVDLLDLQKLKGQDFKPLLESKTAHQVISFGVGLKKLNLDLVLVPYRIQPVEGIQFLLADPLAQLHTDKAKKRALWINLQVLFGVA
jgi:DNA polymerase III psi subunit